MKWNVFKNDITFRKRFAFLPILTCHGDKVWLEHYYSVYTFNSPSSRLLNEYNFTNVNLIPMKHNEIVCFGERGRSYYVNVQTEFKKLQQSQFHKKIDGIIQS